VDFFTQVRYRDIKPQDKNGCAKWFNEHDFYFFTKRPDSLSPGNVDSILNSSYVFTDEKGKAVGLIKFDSNYFSNSYVLSGEFRFADREFYTNSMGEKLLFGFIHSYFYETNKFLKRIMFRVYEFDQITINFLNRFAVCREACLKDHVYKNGKFNNFYIYGISREEYLLANHLKG
jgi:hypothetical protein